MTNTVNPYIKIVGKKVYTKMFKPTVQYLIKVPVFIPTNEKTLGTTSIIYSSMSPPSLVKITTSLAVLKQHFNNPFNLG